MNGETNQSFTPQIAGNYAVIVTKGACADFTACVFITPVGIELKKTPEVNIVPNPAQSSISVTINEELVGSYYFLADAIGKTL